MSNDNKIQIVIGILGAVCIIIAAVIGINYGEDKQNKIVQSQIANVSGDGNTVTMNDVNDLVDNYNKLLEENKTLKEQNSQYFNDYKSTKEEKDSLQTQLQDSPNVQLKNLGLCINSEDININNNNSYAIINGVEYFSRDFINSLAGETTSIIIKDDIMYLGKVIADKENLFSQRVVDSQNCEIVDSVTDSYGNIHNNAAKFQDDEAVVDYNLNGKYSLLKFKIAMDEDSDSNHKTTIKISADGKVVYTSDELNKVSTKEVIIDDIHINNCTLLEIKTEGAYDVYPIIYDAEVYN